MDFDVGQCNLAEKEQILDFLNETYKAAKLSAVKKG